MESDSLLPTKNISYYIGNAKILAFAIVAMVMQGRRRGKSLYVLSSINHNIFFDESTVIFY